ncbi:ligand-dependent nuclear receptor corepressor-like protein isoform X2 [Cololabis saira]|uniref:ligand-dependent nuclear receptor corepressor-like protein isoform X2 n=1 Tax=Cololabis saira TaxID=129043 RepID=UPI002AD29001|nr:ligand-dependent nuclear receptor corepressor-like protein isoform X2 [Cololabis saira]
MAAVQCSKCTGERKGFRRELDSWRHRLIHCVGFESILEGIYGPMLLKDINLFADCEPEEIDDWSPEASLSRCSFCKLPLEKLNLADRVPTATSPLSCPSDYSSSQAPTISESSQSAHRFLQAVFHKKDVPLDGDSKIPLVAQDLMKKMIHQFAVEYASKCLLRTNINGVTRTSSPSSETSDSPLDLTMSRTPEEVEPEPEPVDGVLDLSKGNSVSSAASSSSCNHRASGRQHRQKEYTQRSWELSEGLLSKALKDIRSGRLQEQRAALLYGIPLQILRQGLDDWDEGRLGGPHRLTPGKIQFRDEVTLTGKAHRVLQDVAARAEEAEIGGVAEDDEDFSFPSALSLCQPSGLTKTLPQPFTKLRDALQPSPNPTPSLESSTPLRIPQVRFMFDRNRSVSAEHCGTAENRYHRTSLAEGTTSLSTALSTRHSSIFKLKPPILAQGFLGGAGQPTHRLGQRGSSLDESEEGAACQDKDKQPRKKRGRYRQYDHELMEEAITMVMGGRMSVSKAQGVYGVPHSTLEYKIKERTGTLKNPPKKKSANFCSSNSNSAGPGTITGSTNSGSLASAADEKRF